MVASLTGAAGYAEMSLGRIDEGREALERALALNVAGGYRGRAADNRFALGNLHRKAQRLAESAAMYAAALTDASDTQDAARTLTYPAAIASWAADAGRLAPAVRLGGAVQQAASAQGGALRTIDGLYDPVTTARDRGLDEGTLAAETAIGQALTIDDAVAYAQSLLAQPITQAAASH